MAKIESVKLDVTDWEKYTVEVKTKITFGEADKKLDLKHRDWLVLYEKKDLTDDDFMPYIINDYEINNMWPRKTDHKKIIDKKWIFEAKEDPKELTFKHSISPSFLKKAAWYEDDLYFDIRAIVVLANELNGLVIGYSNVINFYTRGI